MDNSEFSALEARMEGLIDYVLQKPAVKAAYEHMVKDTVTYGTGMSVLRAQSQGFIIQPIDSMTSLGNAIHKELALDSKNMRMFVVKDNAVIHSESAIYASSLRKRISDLHKQDPRAKYFLLTRSSRRWELYCGKKPFNNSIADRFKPLLPRAVPGVLQAYQLICPEDA